MDVVSEDPYYHAVQYLYDHQLANGVSSTDFNPAGLIDRAQLLTFLGRILGVSREAYHLTGSADDGWSTGYVAWGLEKGLIEESEEGGAAVLSAEQIDQILAKFGELCQVEAPQVSGNSRGEAAIALAKLHQELQEDDALVRSTQYGDVKGVNQDGVQVYYGIPYGANPVDELRWAAPAAPEAWAEVRDCTEKEPISLQLGTVTNEDGSTETKPVGSTDCLNLDIYTTSDAKNLPVLVYVHGGNNQTGSSYGEVVGNDLVVRDDCVVVSLNYRTGLLGFNCLPALQTEEGSTGNYGMLDIACALQWVKDNISSFGGDASNVTVSGFSAGGRDVMAMLVSPLFEGLFQRAIAFSGGMTICDVKDGAAKDAELIAPLAVEDGKAETEEAAAQWLLGESAEVRDYLYSIDANRLTKLMTNAGIRMAKFPHLFGDDVVLPSGGFEGANYVNDVPVIMLTGSSEFSMFNIFDSYYDTLEDKAVQEAAKTFATNYGSDFYRTFNTQLSAETMADSYQSKMYLCQIDYGGTTSPSKIPDLGSFHGIFVPALTDDHNYKPYYDFTQTGYQALATDFNVYLKNFLHTGDPNGEGVPTEWTAWTKDTKQTLILDADEESGKATAEMKNVFKTNAEIIEEIEKDDTLPEEVKSAVISTIMNGRWFSDDLDAHFKTPSLW